MQTFTRMICVLFTLPMVLAAQTAIPGMTVRPIATHGSMRLSSDKVVLCGTKDDGSCLIFQSNDLPEDKPMTVQAVMAKPFTPDEEKLLVQPGYKSATVMCASVAVSELTNPRNGRVMKMAVGKDCAVDGLKLRAASH